MSAWQGNTYGTPLGYRIFHFVIKYLGLRTAYFCLLFVAFYFLFIHRARKPIAEYYKTAHRFNGLKLLFFLYKNFFLLGQILIDKAAALSGMSDKFNFTFEGEEFLDSINSKKTGGILLGAHVGSWQLGRTMLERVQCRFNLVMLDKEIDQAKNYLANSIDDKNVHIIRVNDSLSHVFEINHAIKKKEVLSFHGDRALDKSKAVSAQFFGKNALFPIGPFKLAAQFNIPIIFFFILKERKRTYRFIAGKPIFIEKEREELGLISYIAQLETILKDYPAQWFNYFDFWSNEKE